MGLRGGGAGCGKTQAAPRPADPSSNRKRRSGPQEDSGKKRRLSGGRNRRRRRALPPARHPRPDAPFNSTQFLMNDHVEQSEAADLDSALCPPASRAPSERTAEAASAAVAKRKGTRARESSFSLDSDEDYYYSSPEDEEDFVCQEFIKEYNSQRRCRLVDMSKADLIQEYLRMERRVDNLNVRLNRPRTRPDNAQEEDSNTAEQIRHYQREILRLEAENEKLRNANTSLMAQKDSGKAAASDSDCSTCSSCSSSSSSEEEDEDEDSDTEKTEPAPPPTRQAEAGSEAKGNEGDKETDTGYESSNSGSNKALKGEATSTCTNV